MSEIPRDRVGDYAWSGLRRFHNAVFVADLLSRLHAIPAQQRQNAEKQAAQIRYALLQAKEYFDASRVATLATQPNLMYYCAMSLVLAEILMKQTGDSSLDRAREQHRHHGLLFRCAGRWSDITDLGTAGGQLRALPLLDSDGEGLGTFELWHRSARELPVGGIVSKIHTALGASSSGFRLIFGANDTRLNKVPTSGLSLVDCIASIPGMEPAFIGSGVKPTSVRATLEVSEESNVSIRSNFVIVVHPGDAHLTQKLMDNVLFAPSAWSRIGFIELPSGGIVQWHEEVGDTSALRKLPHATMVHSKEVRFWPEDQPLNEFGYLYYALFIAGNYARYYPDWWLRDIERATPLALAVEQLMKISSEQLPLLTLSELSRHLFVRAAP